MRLHAELDMVDVKSELHTVPGGRHGGLNREQTLKTLETIYGFSDLHGLGSGASVLQGQP